MEPSDQNARIERLEAEVARLHREIVEIKRATTGRGLLAAVKDAEHRYG